MSAALVLNCRVCKVEKSKYKCPKCRLAYCSLGCFKRHSLSKKCQVNAAGLADAVKEDRRGSKLDAVDETPLPSTANVPPKQIPPVESEDLVSDKQLKRLGRSGPVRQALKDPVLRLKLLRVYNSSRPALELTNLLAEDARLSGRNRSPLLDFASLCIKTVESDGLLQVAAGDPEVDEADDEADQAAGGQTETVHELPGDELVFDVID